MQLNLIEENQLASLRMFDYGGTKLPDSQTIVILPFELHGSSAAVVFDLGSIIDVPAGTQGKLETTGPIYAVLEAGEQLFSQVASVTGGGYWVTAGGVLFDI